MCFKLSVIEDYYIEEILPKFHTVLLIFFFFPVSVHH